MSRDYAVVRCVCCDVPLDTNDTDRLVHIEGGGLAHRACYDREQREQAIELLTQPTNTRTTQRIEA